MLPTLQQTKELYEFAKEKTDIINTAAGLEKGLSSDHYQNVAWVAAVIAEHAGLNPQKAYILGLLHDFGEYTQKTTPNTFHGTAGYDEMMEKGFDEVARTCLSHSFFSADFTPEDFPAYNPQEIIRASELLKKHGFDDYDRLVHLADLMAPRQIIDTVENRINKIGKKYRLSEADIKQKHAEAQKLKAYFDAKCACDVYHFFGLDKPKTDC